ncbi:MAG: hypothetical protein KBT47_03815, partial [Armatimonadetes bacterium]|nr:hypothetical protein [Candidatus Hippobium faecium]
MKTKKLIIFLCIFLAVFSCFPVYGAKKPIVSKSVLKNKLSDINRQISKTKKKIAEKREEKKEAYGELRSIDRQIESYQSKIAKSQLQIGKYQSEIKDIDKNLAMIEKNLNRRNKLLRDRVSDMYKGGDLQYINVLLDTTDMWSFLTQSYYIKKLIEYDSKLISEIKKDKQDVLYKKKLRKAKLDALKQRQADLIAMRNKHNSLAKNKQKEINSILNDIEREEAAYREEMRSSNRIESQILAMQATPQGKARLSKA